MKDNRKNRKLYAINLKREYLRLIKEKQALVQSDRATLPRPERNRIVGQAFINLYRRGFGGLHPARKRNSIHYYCWGVSVNGKDDTVVISLGKRMNNGIGEIFKHSFKEQKHA